MEILYVSSPCKGFAPFTVSLYKYLASICSLSTTLAEVTAKKSEINMILISERGHISNEMPSSWRF